MTYSGSGIMPPGSATLLDIGDKPLFNVITSYSIHYTKLYDFAYFD